MRFDFLIIYVICFSRYLLVISNFIYYVFQSFYSFIRGFDWKLLFQLQYLCINDFLVRYRHFNQI
jgi:hypothetical protein